MDGAGETFGLVDCEGFREEEAGLSVGGEESGKRAEGKEKVRGGINVSGKVDFV